jgi:hypothetical protein
MSTVTNVMVHLSIMEPPDVLQVLGAQLDGQRLRPITGPENGCRDCWGGPKHPEVRLWAAAFNHLDWAELFRHIEAVPWEVPAEVQVLIAAHEGPKFGLYEFRGGRMSPITTEAAVQLATMGEAQMHDQHGPASFISEGRQQLPRTDAELDRLIDQVTALLDAGHTAIADEVRSLVTPEQ